MSNQRREKGSSIVRVLEVIETIAQSEQPLSSADLAYQLDIPRATAHRLVQTLESEGFIQTNMRGNLIPADRFHKVALGVLYTGRYKAQRRAILENLAQQTGETCGISIPDGTEMIYYDRVTCNWPIQIHLPVGTRSPAWCTASGKLYLSTLSKAKVEKLLQLLPLEQKARNTLITPDALMDNLVAIYEAELGTDNEEFIDGMVACAVPIRNDRGQLIASLFCHAPVIRKNLDDLMAYAPVMRKAADELSQIFSSSNKNRLDQ